MACRVQVSQEAVRCSTMQSEAGASQEAEVLCSCRHGESHVRDNFQSTPAGPWGACSGKPTLIYKAVER